MLPGNARREKHLTLPCSQTRGMNTDMNTRESCTFQLSMRSYAFHVPSLYHNIRRVAMSHIFKYNMRHNVSSACYAGKESPPKKSDTPARTGGWPMLRTMTRADIRNRMCGIFVGWRSVSLTNWTQPHA